MDKIAEVVLIREWSHFRKVIFLVINVGYRKFGSYAHKLHPLPKSRLHFPVRFHFLELSISRVFLFYKENSSYKNPQISSFKRLGLIATILLWFKPLLIFKSNNFQGKKKFTASLQLFLLAKLSLSVLSIILCYFDFGKANLETELNGYFGMRVFKFLMMLAINQIRTKKFWNNQKCYKTVAEMKRLLECLLIGLAIWTSLSKGSILK